MDLSSLEIKVARSENLPVLPQIVSQVLKMIDDPSLQTRALEHVIESDPAITAKVLRVANSSFYGHGDVPSIGRAISLLGLNTVRNLTVNVAFQQMVGGRQQAQRFSKLEFWRHSLATGTCAKVLARLKMGAKAEELYCAGIMHDVGLLVLDRFAPQTLDESLAYASEQNVPLHEAEQELFGFDHAHVGGLLAQRWGLSPLTLNAIKYHHKPLECAQHAMAATIMFVSNALAHQCGFENSVPGQLIEIDEKIQEQLGIPLEQYDVIRDVMVQEVLATESAYKIAA